MPVLLPADSVLKNAINVKFKKVLKSLNEDVRSGKPLSESMGKFPGIFSDLFTNMVKAGEESGGLSSSLKVVSGQLFNSYSLRKKIKGALIYPSIVLVVMTQPVC